MNKKQHISKMGYRDDSPYRGRESININTPSGVIDMSQTGIPLFANGVLLPPYSGQHNMGTTNVTEIPAVQMGHEVKKREGKRENEDGSHSTHLMKTETIDGINWFSFPTLFQNNDGEWIDMSEEEDWMAAAMEAERRGELYHFGTNKAEAIKFGEGSWKPENKSILEMQRGGSLPSFQKKGETTYPLEVIQYPLGYSSMPPGHIEARLLDIENLPEQYQNEELMTYINRWVHSGGNKSVTYDPEQDYEEGVRTAIMNLSESDLENFMKQAQGFTEGDKTPTFNGLYLPTSPGGDPSDYDLIDSNCADGVCLGLGYDESDYETLGITTPLQVMDAIFNDSRTVSTTGESNWNETILKNTLNPFDALTSVPENFSNRLEKYFESIPEGDPDAENWYNRPFNQVINPLNWFNEDGGELPKAQFGNLPFGITGQGFNNIQVPGINWAEGVPELTGTEARQGVNVSGLNLAKDFNLTDNLKLSLSNPAFVYARPTLDNMPVSDGGKFKGLPFEPRVGLTYNFKDGGSLPKAQNGIGDIFSWDNIKKAGEFVINPIGTVIDTAKNKIADNLSPYSYGNEFERIYDAVFTTENKEFDDAYDMDTETERRDLLHMLLGLPQENNSIKPSEYTPSIGHEEGTEYYISPITEHEIKDNLNKIGMNAKEVYFYEMNSFANDDHDRYTDEELEEHWAADQADELEWEVYNQIENMHWENEPNEQWDNEVHSSGKEITYNKKEAKKHPDKFIYFKDAPQYDTFINSDDYAEWEKDILYENENYVAVENMEEFLTTAGDEEEFRGQRGGFYGGVLGNFTLNHGEDEQGKYFSYADLWDLSPFKGEGDWKEKITDFGQKYILGTTPTQVYNRMYYTQDEDGNYIFEEGGEPSAKEMNRRKLELHKGMTTPSSEKINFNLNNWRDVKNPDLMNALTIGAGTFLGSMGLRNMSTNKKQNNAIESSYNMYMDQQGGADAFLENFDNLYCVDGTCPLVQNNLEQMVGDHDRPDIDWWMDPNTGQGPINNWTDYYKNIHNVLSDEDIKTQKRSNLFKGGRDALITGSSSYLLNKALDNTKWGRKLQDKIGMDINLGIFKEQGGELPKAQFGVNSIMSGNAYGARPEGSTGVAGDVYKATGFDEFVKKVDPYITQDNTELVGGFMPFLGEGIDAKNTIVELGKGNYGMAALNALGFALPFVPGKAIVKGYKHLFNKADDVIDAASTTTKGVVRATDNVVPAWSKGVTHYGRVGPEGVEGALTGMKNQGKHLDEIGFDVSTLNGNNMVFHGNRHGRNIVEVALPNGKTQLFYQSSGLAGKSGRGVKGTTEGLWQPFGGHASTSINGNQVDNWFIKDGGYSDFYGSQTFRDISGNLDKIAADMNWDMSGQILKSQRKYGGSIPIAQDGTETGVNFNDLEKGIKWSESLNGTLMKNSETSASGYYGDLFDNLDYDGTRDEFIADTDYQEEYFRKRAHGEVENIPGLINNGTELLEEYKDVDHGLSALEISALSNMLGRQGTREYLGNVIRDGSTLAEVFPHLYGEDVEQTNKTPQEYIDKFNEGLLKKKMGGSVMTKVKRLNQQLELYNKGSEISPIAKRQLESLNMINPKMQDGGQPSIKHHSYVIKKGDNLTRIARDNNMELSDLLNFNPGYMNNPSSIQTGQVLQLSNDATPDNNRPRLKYNIKKGDTLSHIASKYGVKYEDIAKINNISDPRSIQPGQVIVLPDNSNTTNPVVQENIKKAESVYVPSVSEVDVDSNPNVNVPWAKRIPPQESESGQWETIGKRNIKTEINKMDQANRIIEGMSEISPKSTKSGSYTVKSGDNLGKIALDNNMTITELEKLNNIDRKKDIQVGQNIKVNTPTGKPYIIIDEKIGRMHLYYPGSDKPAKSYPILTGENEGDAQTVTKIGVIKNGKTLNQDELNKAMEDNLPEGTDWTVDNLLEFGEGYTTETDWDAGNKQSGAGIYTIKMINEDSGYYDDSGNNNATPSFVLNNSNGDEVPMVIHTVPSWKNKDRVTNLNDSDGSNNRMTNGCINGRCEDLTELYNTPGVGEGTMIYVLPEDAKNNFVFENGEMNFYASSDNQTDYKEYIDENGEVQKGHGIANRMENSYKPINITFDKNYYQTNSERYDGTASGEEEEFVNNTQPFINSLADNKKNMMDDLGMDGDTYNDLAMIAFGIYGYESGMGDEGSTAENLVKAGSKWLTNKTGIDFGNTSPDVRSKHDTYGVDSKWNSIGWTQAKWGYIEKDKNALKIMNKLGINEDNYAEWMMDPEKSAQFTIARLYDFHQKSQASIKLRNKHRRDGTFVEGDDFGFDPVEKYGAEEEVYDPFIDLPKQWSPTSPDYTNFVNKYTDYITLTETDIDDVDNNLIIKGEYTDDNVASNERNDNKDWKEKILNPIESIEQSYNSSDYVKPIVEGVKELAGDAKEWWDEVDLNPFWKRGGEFSVGNQSQFYTDYIDGKYKGTKQENKSKKMYDKLNRIYYNDSKKSNRHQLDIMNSILRSNR